MDDLIDILTKDGKHTGKSCTKSEIHANGYYHNTAHIWFFTMSGQVLLQQRSLNKQICPGLWDVSVAGHVDAGESVKEAAIREVQEELGLTIKEKSLVKIGTFPCNQSYANGIVDNEFHNTFIALLEVDIEDLVFPKNEVEAIKLVDIIEFKELLNKSEQNNHFVASNRKYYVTVLNEIENVINGIRPQDNKPS